MNLEDLPYPMFKLTKPQTEILKEAKELICTSRVYLCDCIRAVRQDKKGVSVRVCNNLLSKIDSSIKGRFCLVTYLNRECNLDIYFTFNVTTRSLRKIWVRKLLEHNNYA